MRIDLINYYELIVNKLDVAIQSVSTSISDAKQLTDLFRINDEAVNAIQVVMKRNLIDLDAFFRSNGESLVTADFEEIKSKALNDYCVYVETAIDREKNPFGILVISDWFIDQNERNVIRFVIEICECEFLPQQISSLPKNWYFMVINSNKPNEVLLLMTAFIRQVYTTFFITTTWNVKEHNKTVR